MTWPWIVVCAVGWALAGLFGWCLCAVAGRADRVRIILHEEEP